MAEQTKIEWVDHTFNPWIGCTRVSPACDNCYAAAMSHRRGWARFEAGAPRKRTTAAYWRQPLLWNRKAEAAGVRRKVFGPSLADPFDAEIDDAWRHDYVDVIEQCPWLDFILLTKRPQVAVKFFATRKVPDNLWPGITAENRKMLELRSSILQIDAKVHVLSAEPLLEDLDALPYLFTYTHEDEVRLASDEVFDADNALPFHDPKTTPREDISQHRFGWVIAGGESGPKARPSHPDWFRALRDQCVAAEVPFFFKQWGEWAPGEAFGMRSDSPMMDRKGHVRDWMNRYVTCDDRADRVRAHSFTEHATDLVYRVGKKRAGTLLDGREHREMPQ